jgi:leucyl-tRNA synthetase
MSYGDGAVMGVPAHDERDFAFAKKYGLPIQQVIVACRARPSTTTAWQDWYADKQAGVRQLRRATTAWPHKAAVDASPPTARRKGLGEKKTTWRLRDWGISRQRYWGTPDPHHPLR